MSVIGRPCYALFHGCWICGKIVKNSFKDNQCTVETKRGTIKVPSCKIRMADKDD